MDKRPKILISRCLLGEAVRWDGGSRPDPFIVNTVGPLVEWLPICPEVECGLGVPRERLNLVGDERSPTMIGAESGRDLTGAMRRWSRSALRELRQAQPWGAILKSRSPSCGILDAPIRTSAGRRRGAGLFTRALAARFPLLLLIDERRFGEPAERGLFFERLFVFARWRELRGRPASRGRLADFHSRHELILMAHSPRHCREMGRLVGSAERLPPSELRSRYEELLCRAMARKATRAKNARVLRRVLGCLRDALSQWEWDEGLCLIASYRGGEVPLLVPLSVFRHYARKLGNGHLLAQHYLFPDPLELRVRWCG